MPPVSKFPFKTLICMAPSHFIAQINDTRDFSSFLNNCVVYSPFCKSLSSKCLIPSLIVWVVSGLMYSCCKFQIYITVVLDVGSVCNFRTFRYSCALTALDSEKRFQITVHSVTMGHMKSIALVWSYVWVILLCIRLQMSSSPSKFKLQLNPNIHVFGILLGEDL